MHTPKSTHRYPYTPTYTHNTYTYLHIYRYLHTGTYTHWYLHRHSHLPTHTYIHRQIPTHTYIYTHLQTPYISLTTTYFSVYASYCCVFWSLLMTVSSCGSLTGVCTERHCSLECLVERVGGALIPPTAPSSMVMFMKWSKHPLSVTHTSFGYHPSLPITWDLVVLPASNWFCRHALLSPQMTHGCATLNTCKI